LIYYSRMNKNKRDKTVFICQNCGTESLRWAGRCPGCDAWNSLVEEKAPSPAAKRMHHRSAAEVVVLSQINTDASRRVETVSPEFNRVLGGGIAAGSVVLVAGDPGIGKSTLLLQEAAGLSRDGFPVLYVTGEESAQQTKMRAERLGLLSDHLYVLAETELDGALAAIDRVQPKFIVVDSIQTLFSPELTSAPGSVSQVRECALRLIQIAKTRNVPIFLVGHVTKEGAIAGPKVLEHMVDALLLFEGDRDHFYRILRAAKNRFGSTREIGVFEMTEKGLRDVSNPSQVFLAERRTETSGSAIICCMEGTRPILVEVQALVSSTSYGLPQRTANGLDYKRVQMLLAVLEKRMQYHVGAMDVFVNAVGGIRIDETAADLGILAAIASSLLNRVMDSHAILLGEVGLGGELRSVSQIDSRISEAEKMGFKRAVIPKGNLKGLTRSNKILVSAVDSAEKALEVVLQ
jgi:DNA repair protein RadA/Sms